MNEVSIRQYKNVAYIFYRIAKKMLSLYLAFNGVMGSADNVTNTYTLLKCEGT